MPGKTKLFLLLSALLLTMCKNYASEPIIYQNGLSCRNYVDYHLFETTEEGADCTYTCPAGSAQQTHISGSISPIYAASSEELNAQFCGIAMQSTPTPTAVDSSTPTSDVPLTSTSSPTLAATLTSVVTAEPLLAETVSMCDLGGKLINFRLLEPAPALTIENLSVEIADREGPCYINPTNRSLLTCTLPNDIRFPVHVIVTMDGAVVNDFEYSGIGCALLTTPTPSKIRSYP